MDLRSLKFVAEWGLYGLQLSGSPEVDGEPGLNGPRGRRRRCDLFLRARGRDLFPRARLFAPEVAGKGVAAVVVDQEKRRSVLSCAVLAVDNPRQALGRLAARYRADFAPAMIGIGGSNGKTSTKPNFVACVLRQKLKTLWSEASFNNDIGVPVTLLKLNRTHEAAVLEAGTNHLGELCAARADDRGRSSGSSRALGASIWNFLAIWPGSPRKKVGWRNCCRLMERSG